MYEQRAVICKRDRMEDCKSRGLYRFRYAWVSCWVLLVSLGGVFSGVHAAGKPFEPEVSAADQRLLQSAMAVGETNTLAAAAMLDTGDRRSAALAFMAGNFYFQAEVYPVAIQAYQEAIEKLPRFRAAKANLGRIYLLQDNPGETIRLYQGLVSDGQADAEIYLLLGHALQVKGRPVSAETAFRNALLLKPDKVEALTGLTQTLLELERYKEALALTAEVLGFEPDRAELWRLRANAMMMLSKYEEAIRTIEVAKRLALADADMLALQGDLLLHTGHPGDALAAYMLAFDQIDPTPERVLRAIEGFLLLEDSAGVEKLIGTVDIAVWPLNKRGALLRLQSQLALQEEQMEQAREFAQEAVTINPLDGGALLLLASIAEQLGDVELAVLYCERAARIPGHEVNAWVRQAQIEASRNRIERAIALLESAQMRQDQPHVARYLDQLRRMQR